MDKKFFFIFITFEILTIDMFLNFLSACCRNLHEKKSLARRTEMQCSRPKVFSKVSSLPGVPGIG